MPPASHEAALNEGDAFRITLRNMVAGFFHIEKIAFGSVMVRVESWDGRTDYCRAWPGDAVELVSGQDKVVARLEVGQVSDDMVMARCVCPLDKLRFRMRRLKLSRARVRRVPDPDRLVQVPSLVR